MIIDRRAFIAGATLVRRPGHLSVAVATTFVRSGPTTSIEILPSPADRTRSNSRFHSTVFSSTRFFASFRLSVLRLTLTRAGGRIVRANRVGSSGGSSRRLHA